MATGPTDKVEKFINREEEVQFLEKIYQKTDSSAQLFIMYGKRRVGKTELIKHVFSQKPSLYYLATKGTAKDQLRTLTELVTAYFHEEYIGKDSFPTFRELFDYMGKRLKDSKEKLVFIVDEFPYLVESNKAVSSYFQYGWDEQLKNTNTLFIIMGSSIAMMYKHALVKSAPLYGRRTGSWLLEPFTFNQARQFYPSASFARAFSFFAILGGIPAYLKEFDSEKDLIQNIAEKILEKRQFLNVEPSYLLSEEFKEPHKYLTILKAVGLGQTKYGQLIQTTGLANNELSSYLHTLVELKLVKREVPITEKNPHTSKKGTYSLADPFLRFYFSLILPNQSLIEGGSTKALFERYEGVLTGLLSKAYEDAGPEFIRQAIKEEALPHFEEMGRWWDNNTEIDLVGLNAHDNEILFVETKWSSKPIGTEVLNTLKKKSHQVQWGRPKRKEYFALIAKAGFIDQLIEVAKKEGVVLIQEDRLLK